MARFTRDYVRAFVRSAHLQAIEAGGGMTAQTLLEALMRNRFTEDVSDGRTIIATEVEDQKVQFAIPTGLTALDTIALADRGLQWLAEQSDPANPEFSRRRVNRLRVSFRRTRF